jgi:tetratricopeptide (TPR) repeat protein
LKEVVSVFILAKGKLAKHPYEMPYTGKKVYSIEELCCYIYTNIYTINEDFFQPSLTEWLKEETELPELADKLSYMIEEEHGLKDLVVTTLCGCDYYREDEVRKMVELLDEIANLPVFRKKKIKADNYLRAGRYGKSLLEYRKLLHGSFAINFTPEEYGDILHNEGIAHFYTSSFAEAKEDFKEAFVRNNKKDSLWHYLWILLMEEEDALFESEGIHFGLTAEELRSVRLRYQEAAADFHLSEDAGNKMDTYKEQMRHAFAR